MLRRRALAGAVLGAGALVLLVVAVWLPPPKLLHPQEAPSIETSAARYSARIPQIGGALMRYDATRDVTYTTIGCGHGPCMSAIAIRGDRTADLPPQFILVPSSDRSERVPLDPPLGGVDHVLEDPFTLVPRGPGIFVLEAGILLAVAGLAGLPRGASWRSWGVAGALALAGVAAAHASVTSSREFATFLAAMLLVAVGGLGAATGALARKPVVLALFLAVLAGAVACLATLFTAGPYYPSPPEA